MNKTLLKENVKEIKETFKRFLSILLIVLLGVGFFAGIKATSPDMQKTVDTYFDRLNVMDFEILSTMGLSDKDVQAISEIEEIEEVMPVYSGDAIVKVGEEEYVVTLQSMPEQLNQLEVIEGRLPQQEKECVVEKGFLTNSNKTIGDNIFIEPEEIEGEDGTSKPFVKQTEMKIVGVVQSPLYISRERGSSKLGSGKVNYYMYVSQDLFDMDVYTGVYLTVKDAKQLSSFSKEYEDKIDVIKQQLEEVAGIRQEDRYQEILEKANETLEEAQTTLEEEKKNAQIKIEEAKQKIQNAKQELQKGKEEISKNEKNAASQLASAEKQLQQAEQEITNNRKQFNTVKEEAQKEFTQAKQGLKQIEEGIEKAEQGISGIIAAKKQAEQAKKELEHEISSLKEQITDTQDPAELAMLQQKLQIMQQTLTQTEDNIVILQNKAEEVEEQRQTLMEQKETISNKIQQGEKELKEKETLLLNAEKELQAQKATLAKEKKTTNQKIANAKAEMIAGEKEIAENEKKLEEESKKAQEAIEEAEDKIQEAKDKIRQIKKPQWYVLNREQNAGYASYKQDTQRIANIGKVFPMVFFVVAALISLTSMTRMVEEQRSQIGTLKAIGYHKIQIMAKYLWYAASATVIGSLVGMSIGFKLLPALIFNMYQMMYTLPPIVLEFNNTYAFLGLGIALVCTCGATLFSGMKELSKTPAELMRPKAPKPGKRVLLERIEFIWSRLKFTQKVTVRNIFRYKKRFLMTIIGICGCTSLIVAGFALRDAISTMIPNQYGKIATYDMQITFKSELSREEIKEKTKKIAEKEQVKDSINVNMQSATVNGSTQSVQLVIPEEKDRINDFITLKPRKNKEITYSLGEESSILTEKLAELLGVKKGDTIKLKNADDIEVEVKVGEITENYISHYVYLSPTLYQKLYQEEPKYNVLLSKNVFMNPEQENQLAKEILEEEEISSVNFTSATQDIFEEVMGNMSFVVWILIISAGLLAFVVLYNLSNVNIGERIRELATIKVLGFYDKEVYHYVSRETIILTSIGIAIGLVMGYFLNIFILDTCELDMMMFARDVSPLSYLYGIIITAFFAIIVNIVTYFSLKKIDMIESLKSVE